jgi:hypothetical protein
VIASNCGVCNSLGGVYFEASKELIMPKIMIVLTVSAASILTTAASAPVNAQQPPGAQGRRRRPRMRRLIGSFARKLTARQAANYFRHAGYA